MPEPVTSILVIDDNEAERYYLTRILGKAGFRVLEAATGLDGLRIAESDRPELITLDIRLPDINGFEVCRRLKSNPATRDMQVVHISASFTTPDAKAEGSGRRGRRLPDAPGGPERAARDPARAPAGPPGGEPGPGRGARVDGDVRSDQRPGLPHRHGRPDRSLQRGLRPAARPAVRIGYRAARPGADSAARPDRGGAVLRPHRDTGRRSSLSHQRRRGRERQRSRHARLGPGGHHRAPAARGGSPPQRGAGARAAAGDRGRVSLGSGRPVRPRHRAPLPPRQPTRGGDDRRPGRPAARPDGARVDARARRRGGAPAPPGARDRRAGPRDRGPRRHPSPAGCRARLARDLAAAAGRGWTGQRDQHRRGGSDRAPAPAGEAHRGPPARGRGAAGRRRGARGEQPDDRGARLRRLRVARSDPAGTGPGGRRADPAGGRAHGPNHRAAPRLRTPPAPAAADRGSRRGDRSAGPVPRAGARRSLHPGGGAGIARPADPGRRRPDSSRCC